MTNTIFSALIAPLKEKPSHIGIFLDTEHDALSFISYSDLYRKISSATRWLHGNGIVKGSRVVLPFVTSSDCIAVFLALICIGALPLSVRAPSAMGNVDEYEQFLRILISQFDAELVIDVSGMERLSLPVPRVRIRLENADTDSIECAEALPEETAFVQFSSGTTNRQKGIPIRHDQLVRQLSMILSQDRRTVNDVGASWLPLYHDMGLIGALLTSMFAGHSLHLCSPARFLADPIAWVCMLAEQGVSITAMPSFGIAYLLKNLKDLDADSQAMRFDRLRWIYLGSDSIDLFAVNQLSCQLAPYGLSPHVFTPCYGMAEAVLMVSCKPYCTEIRTSAKAGMPVVSVGALLEGFEIKLIREDGESASQGELGEICLRGGTLSEGYFEDDRHMLGQDGFYNTGDIGYVEDGELFITGRIGERVKINGQNHYLSHLESVLQSHPELRPGGVAVIQAGGDLVVLAEPARFRGKEQLCNLRSDLSHLLLSKTSVKVPVERVMFVCRRQIPRTSSGKLQRNLVSKAFMNSELKFFET